MYELGRDKEPYDKKVRQNIELPRLKRKVRPKAEQIAEKKWPKPKEEAGIIAKIHISSQF